MSESKAKQKNNRHITIEATEQIINDQMTVGALKEVLYKFDDDLKVYVSVLTGSGYACEWQNNFMCFRVTEND